MVPRMVKRVDLADGEESERIVRDVEVRSHETLRNWLYLIK